MSLVAAPETKLAPARLELIAGDGSFSGYASLFDRVDLAKDRVRRGAFRDSLVRRGISGIRMLWQHDAAEPIGVWLAMAEDERGLAVRGRLATDVARAREARALLKDGALDGLSIGFRTEKAHTDPKTGIRDLLAVDLWEVSLVTFPSCRRPGWRRPAARRRPRASSSPRSSGGRPGGCAPSTEPKRTDHDRDHGRGRRSLRRADARLRGVQGDE